MDPDELSDEEYAKAAGQLYYALIQTGQMTEK